MTAYILDVAGRTDVGNEREHNEDNFLLADLSARTRRLSVGATPVGKRGVVLAVCDGMGGAAAGEVASELAVGTIFDHMTPADEVIETRDMLASRLETAAYLANAKIHDDATENPARQGMGTTLTAVATLDDHLLLAHVGDSRAYLWRRGVLTQVTRDQSLVAKLVERGTLTEEQALTFEHSNIILQALGASASVIVEMTQVRLRRGDRLLLCSDGLSGLVPKEEIRTALGDKDDPTAICIKLINRAKELGGHDNITAIVGFFDGDALLDDDSPVQVQRYGGETELLAIPDPRRLGELLNPASAAGSAGTAVLAAVVPDPDGTAPPESPPPPTPTPTPPPPPTPTPTPTPAVALTVPEPEEMVAPEATSLPRHQPLPNIDLPSGPPEAPPARAYAAPSLPVHDDARRSASSPPPVAARRKGRDPLVLAAGLLGIAIVGGSAVFVLAGTRATNAATRPSSSAPAATDTQGSTWTSIESAPTSSSMAAIPSPSASGSSPPAKPEPRPGSGSRAEGAKPLAAPKPTTSSLPSRRGELAPLRDDE